MRELSLRHRRKPETGRKFVLLILFVVALLGLSVFLFLPTLRGVALTLVRPIWAVESNLVAGVDAVTDLAVTKSSLRRSLAVAEKKLLQAQIMMQRYKVLEEENLKLKQLLGKDVYESKVLAAVLARPAITPYDTLLIDAGSSEIAAGDRVVIEGSIIIGTISEVHKSTSQVVLFSAPGVETQVLIGPDRIPVTAKGQGGGSFVAEFPRDATVEEGYSVVMPGINPYVFATVESAEAIASDPFISVRFKNPLNVQAITWVQVLKNDAERPLDVPLEVMPVQGTSTEPDGTSGTSTSSFTPIE